MDLEPEHVESLSNEYLDTEQNVTNKPSPANLMEFLPWACRQLQFSFEVLILKNKQESYLKYEDKKRSNKSHNEVEKPHGKVEAVLSSITQDIQGTDMDLHLDSSVVRLTAIFNALDQLVEIKFTRNKVVPCELIKLLGQITKFYPLLHAITISRGIDSKVIYEISQFLPSSFITEICLDGYFLKEANYHLLLKCSKLKYLSLNRCMINDDVTQLLASQLIFNPEGNSTVLAALNLSCNVITDRGAIALANMLRSNRTVAYLNLAGNQITDVGGCSILEVLVKFRMSSSEIMVARKNLMTYSIKKRDIMSEYFSELQKMKETPAKKKRPSGKASAITRNKAKSDNISLRLLKRKEEEEDNNLETELIALLAKAEEKAIRLIGVFVHPFSKENTIKINNVLYCKGNNTLGYLSLAYNSLSIIFLRQLHSVLIMQACYERQPRGLGNVSLDGNNLPKSCAELYTINTLLKTGLQMDESKNLVKSRAQTKRKESRLI